MPEASTPRKSHLKIVLILAALAVVLIMTRSLPVSEWLESFNEWVKDLGPLGYFVFAAFYILATIFFLPGSILTLGAGFIYGVVKGSIIVSISSVIGVSVTFLIARYLARDWVTDKFGNNPHFRAIDTAIGNKGGKIVLMLRLSPAFPFNVLNYLLGLTAVPFWSYVFASWLGMLPGTVLYVYLGYIGKTGLEAASGRVHEKTPLEALYLVIGLVITVLVTIYVTQIARKALNPVK